MFLVIFKFLRALFPYLKESFFGKQPLPEIIYRNRVSAFFIIATVFFFVLNILYFDIVTTTMKERDKLKKDLSLTVTKIQILENEIESTKKNLDPVFYQGIIKRLEEEVSRLDKENDRYRKIIEAKDKELAEHH